MPEQVEAVVIGGGQAGLAISYYLTRQGRPHVVLEQAAQVAPAWRHGRWDSFTLVTPNWSVRLPDFPYQRGDPDGFMPGADVVHHLEQYAASFQAPVHCGVQVTGVDPAPDGQGYRVATADGATYAAATVVVATGSFQFPKPSPSMTSITSHSPCAIGRSKPIWRPLPTQARDSPCLPKPADTRTPTNPGSMPAHRSLAWPALT